MIHFCPKTLFLSRIFHGWKDVWLGKFDVAIVRDGEIEGKVRDSGWRGEKEASYIIRRMTILTCASSND